MEAATPAPAPARESDIPTTGRDRNLTTASRVSTRYAGTGRDQQGTATIPSGPHPVGASAPQHGAAPVTPHPLDCTHAPHPAPTPAGTLTTMRSHTHLWNPDTTWLNTAQYGLPPATAHTDLARALHTWSRGTGDPAHWAQAAEDTRTNLAHLVGATRDDIALGATTSQLVATIAASLPDGAHVLAPEGDYTSLTFPFHAHSHRAIRVHTAPLHTLAEHIGPRTHTVAFSLVQSASGDIAPVKDIVAAARTHGARTVVDATQAAGWLPLHAPDHDAVIASAYKWLMAPRGLAFAYLAPHLRPHLHPVHAGPSAAADPFASFYTDRMDLAGTARALDLSPNWFACVAAARSTQTLREAGVHAVHAHNTALADRLRAHLDLPPARSAITTLDRPDAHARLARAGITTTQRAGRTRLAFHLYNTVQDADRAADALT